MRATLDGASHGKGVIETDYLEALGKLVPVISGLCAVIGALAGWIASARASRSQREEALAVRQRAISDGVLALLRAQLVDAYERYVAHGEPLTVERRHEIDRCFEAYEALGGNGTVRRLYEEFCRRPTYIVGESE